MTDTEKKKILIRLEKIEAFAEAALNEATALRIELAGSGVPNKANSPHRGKAKKAALAVLKTRRSNINRNNQE